MMMSTTTIRIDDALKKDLDKRLKETGLTLNGYLNLAIRQFVIQNKVPFEVLTPEAQPNETTRRAIVEAEAKALGLIPDHTPSFTDAKSALAYLDQDEK
ncbi:damage-inducible protein J [Loigolactobacillus bifermentans]|nr:type II toxin-antitoxin system RelB/DinJ family antitoxin [Loigolactobacillus bifermentans]QGG61900.1 damage-inducible protein J [Loigolactobacillus bifermentans]